MKLKLIVSLVIVTVLLTAGMLLPGSPAGYAAPLASLTGTPTEPAPPTGTVPPPTGTVPPGTATPTLPPPPPGTPTQTPPPETQLATFTATPPPETPEVPGTPPPPPPPPRRDTTPTPELIETPVPVPTEVCLTDPAIEKRVNNAQVSPGDTLNFTLRLSNLGNLPADNVTLTDTVPAVFEIVNVTTTRGEIRTDGQTVVLFVEEMGPGEIITVTITTRVRDDAEPGTVFNQALITTTSGCNDPTNDQASVPVEIVSAPIVPAVLPVTGAVDSLRWLLLMALVVTVLGSGLLLMRRRA